jgi:hypothetical protein
MLLQRHAVKCSTYNYAVTIAVLSACGSEMAYVEVKWRSCKNIAALPAPLLSGGLAAGRVLLVKNGANDDRVDNTAFIGPITVYAEFTSRDRAVIVAVGLLAVCLHLFNPCARTEYFDVTASSASKRSSCA